MTELVLGELKQRTPGESSQPKPSSDGQTPKQGECIVPPSPPVVPVSPPDLDTLSKRPPCKEKYEEGPYRYCPATYNDGTTLFHLEFLVNCLNGLCFNNDGHASVRVKNLLLIFALPVVISLKFLQGVSVAGLSLAGRHQPRRYFDWARAPWFGFQMQVLAIFGLFMPFRARELIGVVERRWNHQPEKASFESAFYIAPCFQPLSCLKKPGDPAIESLAQDFINVMKANHLLGGLEVGGARW